MGEQHPPTALRACGPIRAWPRRLGCAFSACAFMIVPAGQLRMSAERPREDGHRPHTFRRAHVTIKEEQMDSDIAPCG